MATIYDIAANVPRPQEGPVGALQRARNEKAVRRLNEAQAILMETQAERYNEFKDRELVNQSNRNIIDARTLDYQITKMYKELGQAGRENDKRQLDMMEGNMLTARELYNNLRGTMGEEVAIGAASDYIRRFDPKLERPFRLGGYNKDLGEALFDRNQRAKTQASLLPAELQTLNALFPDSFQNETRATARNAANQGRQVDNIAGIFSRAIKQGVNPDIILATPGSIMNIINNIKSGATAASDYIGALIDPKSGQQMFQGDATTVAGQNQLVQGSPAVANAASRIQVPENILGAELQAQYKSAVIALAWATWRAMEGSGSRQSSDQDFARALDRIGAASGSSRNMLSTISTMLGESLGQFQDLVSQVEGVSAGSGISSQSAKAFMFGGLEKNAEESIGKAQTSISGLIQSISGNGPTDELKTLEEKIIGGNATKEEMDRYEELIK